MVHDRLIKIIKNYTEIPAERIRPETGLRDFGLTSFDVMNIISDCEYEFHIVIPDHDIHTLQTVQDIVAYLTMKQNDSSGQGS